MYPTTGYTRELSEEQKRANLRRTLELFVRLQPDNDYWSSQLDALKKQEEDERERQAAEIARDAEWMGLRVVETPESDMIGTETDLYLQKAAEEMRKIPDNFGMIVLVGEELDAATDLVQKQKRELGFSTIEGNAYALLRCLTDNNEWARANVAYYQKSMDEEIEKERAEFGKMGGRDGLLQM